MTESDNTSQVDVAGKSKSKDKGTVIAKTIDFGDDLEAFLDNGTDFGGPSLTAQKAQDVALGATRHQIAAELARSQRNFIWVFLLLSFLGFVGSLALCAQNSFGLTGFSNEFAMLLHTLPDPWCPIICGVVFAGPSVALYAVALDRFQWRRLTHTLWWLPICTTAVACVVMLVAPETLQHEGMRIDHGGGHALRDRSAQLGWMAFWFVGALVPPLLVRRWSRAR
jgi:hypothetical protein